MLLCKLDNLSFKYNISEDYSLQNISMEINQGDKILLVGKKGSSKSTLLKMLKDSIKPYGETINTTQILIPDTDISYVPQNVSATFLSKKVVSNIVFSAENMGLPPKTIHQRLSEICLYLSITNLLDKNIDDLSGGEKTLVAIAGAIITYPKILLLDEPLSELSIVYRKKIIDILTLLNDELNMSIIMCEHHISDCITFPNKVSFMKTGYLTNFDNLSDFMRYVHKDTENNLFIPELTRLSLSLYDKTFYNPKEFSLTYKEQRPIIEKNFNETLISIKNIIFFYDKRDIIFDNLSLDIHKSEKLALLGDNGSGKTTLLKIICKSLKIYDGTIKYKNTKIAYLPQDIVSYFTKEKVYMELEKHHDNPMDSDIVKLFQIEHLFDKSPYDLSSGEALIVCLCSVILSNCDILILDEPTKNLDPFSKEIFGQFIKNSDLTVVLSTHDLEFCANYIDNCAFIFNKKIAYTKNSKQFMLDNTLFTTALKKATNTATTYDEAIDLWS